MSSDKKYKLSAIILAAGSGTRMGGGVTKQNRLILGQSVLSRSVAAFEAAGTVDNIVVVAKADELDALSRELCSKFAKLSMIIVGGSSRFDSAREGFSAVCESSEYVAIHDAARCLITPEQIDSVAAAAFVSKAATASTPVTDTIKRADESGTIRATVDRSGLYHAQTPQIFSSELYKKAVDAFDGDANAVTDDNMLLERIGVGVTPVNIGKSNIKITTAEDLVLAEFLLSGRA